MCFDIDSAPPIGAAPAAGVRTARITLTAADGAALAAFSALPPAPPRVGVIVLPDVRGLYAFYEQLAVALANHGHAAVAIDYFGRTAGTAERSEDFPYMEHLFRTSRSGVQADFAAAAAYLRSPEGGACEAVFTVGFCFGGRHSFLAATGTLGLAGVVGFYGNPDIGPDGSDGPTQLAATMTAPVLAIMGGADESIPADAVAEFDQALSAAGVEHEVVTHPDAPHSFFDHKHAEFTEASADAWRRALSFLGQHA